jgi:hypothetical protein
MTLRESAAAPDTGPSRFDISLTRHPFLYAGEWQRGSFDEQRMYLVENGSVVWTYTLPHPGEFGDVSQLSSGNILFAWYGGAREITLEGETVWEFHGPDGSEIHTCQPLPDARVFLMINAVPARAVIINRLTGETESEIVIPTGGSNTHGMFRHCRVTDEGTYLVAHMDMGKVVEYDQWGREIWSVKASSPWAAVRLDNGNTLISGDASHYVSEVDHAGHVVWMFGQEQAREHELELFNVQQCARLSNGNTVIANWCGGDLDPELQRETVQLIEVDPNGAVVWAISEWETPNLGVASNFHIIRDYAGPTGEMHQR